MNRIGNLSPRSSAEFGRKFVWCVEHDRSVDTCRQLAVSDFGQPAFDNCQWVTEAELLELEGPNGD